MQVARRIRESLEKLEDWNGRDYALTRTAPLVFISCSILEVDIAALARLIAERLRRDGAEVFFDERIHAGQDWNTALEGALDVCDVFCTLLSGESLASPLVQNEIARIGERWRRHGTPEIWPVRCRFDGRLPYDISVYLRRIQYVTWQGEADTSFLLDEILHRWRELRDGPKPEPPPPALCTLPGRIADFTGREPEIADLIAALCRQDRRAAVSAIGGMGGVGKTTLAIEAAWRMAGCFPDGILYIDMLGFGTAPPLTPAEAITTVIEQLEPTARLPDRLDQLLPLYRRLLAGRKLLLLLDNVRETAQVADLVPPPPVALLVTSRHQIFLDGATRLDLDVMSAEEGRALLRGVVDARRATDSEIDTLAERCGRLPLALRAAGAYLQFRRDLKVSDYLVLLADERRRLDSLKVPQAARDVRATLGLTGALLDADDPGLAARWRRLAVFSSAFLPDAAAAVWGATESDATEALDRLVARSLLVFERETQRYRLHDLVRTAAGEGLDDDSRLQAELAHAEHYCTVLSRADDLYLSGGSGVMDGLALFDQERPNIAVGQRWAATHRETQAAAARLAYAYTNAGVYVLDVRLLKCEWIAWLDDAVAAGRALGDRLGEGSALGNLGIAWADLGETRRAIEHHEQVLAIAREIGDRRGEGNALGNLGIAWATLGETRKAIEHYEQVLAMARELGDRRVEGNALGNLGNAWAAFGETRKAIEHHEQYLVIAREIGDHRGEGNALGSLGIAWAALGETRRAIEHYEQVLAITREIGDRRSANTALWNMAVAHDLLGDQTAALACARESLMLHRQIEDPFTPKVEAWLRERGVDPDGVDGPQ